jgi:hypothetical protein
MRAAFIAVLVTAAAGCEKADEPQTRSANPAVAAPRAATPAKKDTPDAITSAAPRPGMTRVAAPPAKAIVKTPPAPADGRALDALAFTVPSGWTAELDAGGQWNFESNGVEARLNRAPKNVPTTGSGYLEYKIEWCWDPGTTADLVDNQSRPGGFGATMLVRDAEDPDNPRLAYHAVWEVDGVRLRCEADRVPDEHVRDQIAALCGSARW